MECATSFRVTFVSSPPEPDSLPQPVRPVQITAAASMAASRTDGFFFIIKILLIFRILYDTQQREKGDL